MRATAFGMMLALAPCCAMLAAADPADRAPLGISELKFGALAHDVPGLWSGFSREKSNVDANFEAVFVPWATTFGGELKPAIGTTVNFNGDTSRAYADLKWERPIGAGLYFGLGFGAAIHNGDLNYVDDTHKVLGSRVLFHPSAELGWRFDGVNSVSLYFDHMSDGWITRNNEGMDSVGVRFGHRFSRAREQIDTPSDAGVADFSGPYLTAFAGYQYGTSDWYVNATSTVHTSGFAAGGLAGYAWQSGHGVFALEVDGTPTTTSSNAACASGVTCRMDVRGLYSVRPKFGWVVDRTMLFFTGGLAIAQWDASATQASGHSVGQVSTTNYGVAIGGGLESKLADKIGLRLEVIHYGVPSQDLPLAGGGDAINQFRGTIGRTGLSWYFN